MCRNLENQVGKQLECSKTQCSQTYLQLSVLIRSVSVDLLSYLTLLPALCKFFGDSFLFLYDCMLENTTVSG